MRNEIGVIPMRSKYAAGKKRPSLPQYLFAISVVVSLAFFAVASHTLHAHAGPNDGIEITDSSLLECVNDVIDPARAADMEVTESEAESLTELSCFNLGITDIDGLEYFTSLTRLSLERNPVSNLDPISELTTLERLTLRNNLITDLSALENLDNLVFLAIGNYGDVHPKNEVSDLTALAGLQNLETLSMESNSIVDLAPLANLTNLTLLEAGHNDIENVEPLANLDQMNELILRGNAIADLSPLESLPASMTMFAGGQLVQLGDVDINQPFDNPLINIDGLPVELSDPSYDAQNNTITVSDTGFHNLPFSSGGFSGTLTFRGVGPDVEFEDPALHEAVNAALGASRAADDPVTDADAASLTALDASSMGIEKLGGLEFIKNLQDLDLANNSISNVEALADLTSLEELRLQGNMLSDLSPLEDLTSITTLKAGNQQIIGGGAFVGTTYFSPIIGPDGVRISVTSSSAGSGLGGPLWHFDTSGVKTLNWHSDVFGGEFSGEYQYALTQGFEDVSGSDAFWDAIAWLDARGVTGGYGDGTFRPKNDITREAMGAFIYRAAGEPAFTPPASSPFRDVAEDDSFYKEITWLSAQGITSGYGDGTFRPGNKITREAMAAFLYRAAGEPSFTSPQLPPFTDVAEDASFYQEINWLNEEEITTGYGDGTFRPKNNVTREATAAFLHRMYTLDILTGGS